MWVVGMIHFLLLKGNMQMWKVALSLHLLIMIVKQ